MCVCRTFACSALCVWQELYEPKHRTTRQRVECTFHVPFVQSFFKIKEKIKKRKVHGLSINSWKSLLTRNWQRFQGLGRRTGQTKEKFNKKIKQEAGRTGNNPKKVSGWTRGQGKKAEQIVTMCQALCGSKSNGGSNRVEDTANLKLGQSGPSFKGGQRFFPTFVKGRKMRRVQEYATQLAHVNWCK